MRVAGVILVASVALAGCGERTRTPDRPASRVSRDPAPEAVFDVGPGITPPLLRRRVPVAPPQDLLGKRLEQRTTIIEMIVEETGKVQQPRIIRSSYPSFDQATIDAVRRWEYEPARRDGRKVPVRVTITSSPEVR